MRGKGNYYDYAVAESFSHTVKTKLLYFEDYQTRDEARASNFEYIEVFYNQERGHSALNCGSPIPFELLPKAA